MDRKTASLVAKELQKASGALNSAAFYAAKTMAPDEYQVFKHKIGTLMGSIYLDILQDLYAEHPELTPKGLLPS